MNQKYGTSFPVWRCPGHNLWPLKLVTQLFLAARDGEKAHSCYFSKDAFKKLKGENKELLILPDTVHTDLYDRKDKIPFDKMENFFKDNLK